MKIKDEKLIKEFEVACVQVLKSYFPLTVENLEILVSRVGYNRVKLDRRTLINCFIGKEYAVLICISDTEYRAIEAILEVFDGTYHVVRSSNVVGVIVTLNTFTQVLVGRIDCMVSTNFEGDYQQITLHYIEKYKLGEDVDSNIN